MKDIIQFSDFEKVDIRVGQITLAEAVPKSKMLKLQVDLGPEIGTRTILASIAGPDPEVSATRYTLEKSKVLVVVNFAPREMKGIVSEGMLLAGVDEFKGICLASISSLVPNGTQVS
jgi:methionine--tRNA ligase beta chain